MTQGTELYDQLVRYAEEHPADEGAQLTAKMWSRTPWMATVFTGSHLSERREEILSWLRERGTEAQPLREISGEWQVGSATLYGWNWVGFRTGAKLRRFLARWPNPPGELFQPVDSIH